MISLLCLSTRSADCQVVTAGTHITLNAAHVISYFSMWPHCADHVSFQVSCWRHSMASVLNWVAESADFQQVKCRGDMRLYADWSIPPSIVSVWKAGQRPIGSLNCSIYWWPYILKIYEPKGVSTDLWKFHYHATPTYWLVTMLLPLLYWVL